MAIRQLPSRCFNAPSTSTAARSTLSGVRAVADVLIPEFRALGFDTRYVELPDSLARGGHLIAERRGSRGSRLLLIGHLDTVFEEDSPFQRFERLDSATARGPGVNDMKGGNIVILQALKALHREGALDNTTITVVLTGDEERPGRPVSVARELLIDAGRRSDIALGFEGGSRGIGHDYGVVGRRSASSWELRVTGTRAHSSGVFAEGVGAGAIYEAARILNSFYEQLRDEEGLTFNPGLIVGGSEADVPEESIGNASGKTNVVAPIAIVQGDIRTLTDAQLVRVRERMREIVGNSLPGTDAAITFSDGYPAMESTPGNAAVLARFDEVSRALGFNRIEPFDPALRGAADISFVAPYVDGLDGLGVVGTGSHTVEERIDLRSMPIAAKRAAVLIHRLTREPATN
jgi:glutamate carboxypeptidase